MNDVNQLAKFLSFSKETLFKAGEILLSYRDTFRVTKTKDPLSLDVATSADYAAEKIIIDQIKKTFPDHSIMTEETQGFKTESDFEWIIDPLDGTKEYIRHSPYFYTLLALEYKGNLICGAGYQPEIQRMFAGAIGFGATVNDHVAIMSPERSLSKSFIYVGLPVHSMPSILLKPYLGLIENLSQSCYRLRNTPWDVEALFNVATGLAEGYILPPLDKGRGPKWWDIASGVAVLTSNGGVITDIYGDPYMPKNNTRGIVASNGKVHSEIIETISQAYR